MSEPFGVLSARDGALPIDTADSGSGFSCPLRSCAAIPAGELQAHAIELMSWYCNTKKQTGLQNEPNTMLKLMSPEQIKMSCKTAVAWLFILALLVGPLNCNLEAQHAKI